MSLITNIDALRESPVPYTVTQDGKWTILHIRSGGTETTTSLTHEQAGDLAEQLTAFPCPVCGNEERGQGGYLSCECPAPTINPTGEA